MNKSKNINFAHINISSITQPTKQKMLKDFLVSKNIQIMSINETYLKEKHKIDLIGYHTYRKDRIGKRKGGVALVKSKTLAHEKIEIHTSPEIEIIAVKKKFHYRDIVVISYYVPPNQQFSSSELNNILINHKNSLILGDFNAKNELWYCRETNKNGEILENVIRQHELCIHNENTPTILYSNNIIDLMISTKIINDKITNIEKMLISHQITSCYVQS